MQKKLIVVAPYFYPKIGGLENYAYHIAKRLHKSRDFDVTVITANHFGSGFRREDLGGMAVYRLPIWFKISNTPVNPLWYWQVKRIFGSVRPDLIHIHAPVPFLSDLAALAAPKKIPVVATYHSGSMKKGRWPIDALVFFYESFILDLFLRRADAIVGISQNYFKTRFAKYANKTHSILPGVDRDRFFSAPLSKDGQIVAYVGKIASHSSFKGIDQLLRAMALVIRTRPQARLELTGGGDAIQYYRGVAESLGIGAAVIFGGPRSENDLARAYHRARVVVLPSVSDAEAFGMVLIEAMASGRPVIGTNVGGIPQVIDDGINGLLVLPKDPAALAAAIVKVLADERLARRLGEAGARKAKFFGWETRADEYVRLFNKLSQSK